MMRLATMWKVDGEVTDEGRNATAEQLLQAWTHEPASARFFRSSANFVYTFRRDGDQHYLRFADDTERARESVEAEVELLSWLTEAGVAVAEPVPADDGRLVVSSATDLGLLHAVVFRRAPGVQVEVEALDEPHLLRWGAALGRLHNALKEYSALHRPARSSWEDDLRLAEAHLPAGGPVPRELEVIRTALTGLPVDEHAFGLIHGDFQLDNLFWNGELCAIDFDDCGYNWFVADVALALDDVLAEDSELESPRLLRFLDGYRDECELDEAVFSRFETFRRAGDLVRYAKVRRALDLAPTTESPAWLRRLDEKLRLHVRAYERRISRRAGA